SMAPEVASGQQAPDIRSDIYGLGCVLYQMLSGKPPFRSGDVARKLQRHQTEAPKPLAGLIPGMPGPLGQIVHYMLEKDPGRRYQSATNVVEALAPFVNPSLLAFVPEQPTASSQAYEGYLRQNQPA